MKKPSLQTLQMMLDWLGEEARQAELYQNAFSAAHKKVHLHLSSENFTALLLRVSLSRTSEPNIDVINLFVL